MDSPASVLRRYWPIVLFPVLCGIYNWLVVVATGTGHDGVIGPRYNALGADWVIFLAAARAFFTGELGHIYDQAWITQATNSQFAHWLSQPLPFPLFPYPPLFLLLVLPFATMPVALSLLLSQLAQFGALAWALRRLTPGNSFPILLVATFLAPAASTNVLAGSNAVLVTALIVGGFAILRDRPFLAGAMLGIMVFKPQFFPLLPLALLASGDRKALAAMAASAAALVLISALLFGPQLWLDWINVYLHPQQVAGVNGTEWGHRWDDSVSTCVALLGAPQALATAAQGLAVLIALAMVWLAFRRCHPQRLAILLCATLLASPHVSNYDLLLLAVAAMLYVGTLAESSRPLALILPLLAWIAPLYNPPRLTPAGLITPLVLIGLIWLLFRGIPARPAPESRNPLSMP